MLADVVMPGVNGAKLALSLIESQPNMKVLFVSGHGWTVARLKGVETDAQFLEKPYPFALLATTVRKMLEPGVKAHTGRCRRNPIIMSRIIAFQHGLFSKTPRRCCVKRTRFCSR
jgi:FixJ family two-component response regulator